MSEQLLCPVCHGKSFRTVSVLAKARLIKCGRCKLIMNLMDPNRSSQGEYYRGDYEKLYNAYYRDFRIRQSGEFLEEFGDMLKGKRLLDIGCSYGMFLEHASRYAESAVGMEPSPEAFKAAKGNEKLEVYNYDISKIRELPGKFDVITLWNVFEHFDDPNISLDFLYEKLNSGGILLLCVPNLKGLITQMSFFVHRATFGMARGHLSKLYQLDNDFPHFFHYTRQNLEQLLKKHSFIPVFYRGRDILDAKRLKSRVSVYTGKNRTAKKLMVFALRTLLRFSRFLKKEDEIVVMARKA